MSSSPDSPPLHCVEAATPLHSSLLWPLQQAWHAAHGGSMSVWTDSSTPLFATSNSFIASAYARVILGLLRDWFQGSPGGGAAAAPPAARDEPVRVLEVGAGHGRLAFLVLRELWSLEEHWPEVPAQHAAKFAGVRGAAGRPCPFRFIVSDIMGACVGFWEAHECLAPFLQAGVLELAVLDVTRSPPSCVLRPSGATLAPGSLASPLVVLANYVFNTLQHDLVRLEQGALLQAKAAIFSPNAADAAAKADSLDPAIISRMRLVWSYEPLADSPAPPSLGSGLSSFLPAMHAHYAATLPTGTVPVPLGGLAAMANLSSLTSAHTVFLVGDKGYNHSEEMAALREPHLGLHGSFSFMANLHAARLFALHRGGFSLHTPFLEGFKCAAFLLWGRGGVAGAPPPATQPQDLLAQDAGELLPAWFLQAFPHLSSAWNDAMDGFGPDAFSTLQRRVVEETKTSEDGRTSLKTSLATLRMACWDPDVFVKLKASIIDGAPGASERTQHDIYGDLCKVYARYYPLRPAHDVAFECGRVCMGLRRYPEAIALFLASMRQSGEHHVTVHNCGICLFHLARFPAAAEAFSKALKLTPTYAEAGHWLHRAEEMAKGNGDVPPPTDFRQ